MLNVLQHGTALNNKELIVLYTHPCVYMCVHMQHKCQWYLPWESLQIFIKLILSFHIILVLYRHHSFDSWFLFCEVFLCMNLPKALKHMWQSLLMIEDAATVIVISSANAVLWGKTRPSHSVQSLLLPASLKSVSVQEHISSFGKKSVLS